MQLKTSGGTSPVEPILFEVQLLAWLPSAVTPDLFKKYQINLTAELAAEGYTGVVLGSATTKECLVVRVTTPSGVETVEEARSRAIDDVEKTLEKLGCKLARDLQWREVRQLVPSAAGPPPPRFRDRFGLTGKSR